MIYIQIDGGAVANVFTDVLSEVGEEVTIIDLDAEAGSHTMLIEDTEYTVDVYGETMEYASSIELTPIDGRPTPPPEEPLPTPQETIAAGIKPITDFLTKLRCGQFERYDNRLDIPAPPTPILQLPDNGLKIALIADEKPVFGVDEWK